MKTGKDEPMQLIGFNQATKKFVINEEAITMIRQIKGPIGVISVAGVYRSGKSFLMNRMLLNRKQGFKVSSTVQAQTKGIWIWGKPVLGQTQKNETINVIILDTEGISSLDRQTTYDTKVIIMSILLSSLLIYNSIGAIQKSQIQTLHGVLKLVDKVSGYNNHSCPSLLWILRDFSLQLKSSEHILFTASQYLQQALKKSSDNQRQLIYKRFNHNIQCATLIRPLMDENSLQYLDTADYEALAPQFVDQLIQLRRKVLNNIIPKQLNSKILNGQSWADMVIGYLNEINNDKLPQLGNIWQYVCRQQCQKHSQIALDIFMTRLKQLSKKQSMSQQLMKSVYKEAKQQALQYMHSKCRNNNQLPSCITELKQAFNQQYIKIVSNIQKQHLEQIKQFLSFQYQSIQRKLKLKQISTLWQYKKQIQMFTQFARKKAGNSHCRQFIGQFINKKIFQAAVLFQQTQLIETQTKKKQFQGSIVKLQEQLKQARKKQNQQRTQLQIKLQKLTDESKQYFNLLKSSQQSVLELKNTKQQAQRQYWQQLLNQKSNYQKIINQLKAKLSISQNTVDEINRQKIILQSQLKKRDMLSEKASQNNNQIVKQQKENYIKLLDKYNQLKQSYHNDIKIADTKHNEKMKQTMNTIEELKIVIIDNQNNIEDIKLKKGEIEEKYRILEQQKKLLIFEIENYKSQIQNQSRITMKKMAQNKFKLQKVIHLQNQVLSLTQENIKIKQSIKQVTSQLDRQRALNDQKVVFLQIQLKQLRTKNEHHQQKFKELLTSFNSQQLKLEQQLSEWKNKQFQLRKAMNLQEISIDELRNKNYDLKAALQQKEEEINDAIKIHKERQQNLENSRIMLQTEMRRLQSQNFKGMKLTEKNAQQQIQRLNRELHKAKQDYQTDVQQIKLAFQQTLDQVRSLHEIQKARMQSKLSDEKSKRQKKSPGMQNIQMNKNIRQFNQKLQDQILDLKKKMWDDEKQYKIKLSQLQTKLTMKNSQIQQIRNNTTINIGSTYKQHDIETKVLKIRVTQQKRQLDQKNNQNKRLLIQNSALNESLKSRMQEIKKIKINNQSTLHQLQSELSNKKQEINLIQTRMNSIAQDNSQFKRSVYSKQESMLNQNKYLQSKVLTREQSPTRIFNKPAIENKLLLALKQIQAIQQIYGKTIKQISLKDQLYKTLETRSTKQKTMLERKLRMMTQFDH